MIVISGFKWDAFPAGDEFIGNHFSPFQSLLTSYNIVTYNYKLYDYFGIYSIVVLDGFYVVLTTFYGKIYTSFGEIKTSKTFWILGVAF